MCLRSKTQGWQTKKKALAAHQRKSVLDSISCLQMMLWCLWDQSPGGPRTPSRGLLVYAFPKATCIHWTDSKTQLSHTLSFQTIFYLHTSWMMCYASAMEVEIKRHQWSQAWASSIGNQATPLPVLGTTCWNMQETWANVVVTPTR